MSQRSNDCARGEPGDEATASTSQIIFNYPLTQAQEGYWGEPGMRLCCSEAREGLVPNKAKHHNEQNCDKHECTASQTATYLYMYIRTSFPCRAQILPELGK